MGQSEGPAHVLSNRDNFCLIWIIAELLIYSFLGHCRVVQPRVDDRVPNEGCHSLRKHVRHELELFAELEAALERLLCQLRLALLYHTFGVVHLHVEVVQV